MINILELESSKGWGGQEKRTRRVINNLSDEFKVFFAVEKDSELYAKQKEINATFLHVKLNKIYNLFTIFKLCKFIIKNNIHIISTHSGKDGWIGNFVGKLTNTKVIRVRHLNLPIKPAGYNLNDKVVCVSQEVKNGLLKDGVKKDKLEVIYTGVDTKRFNPLKTYDLRKELHVKDDCLLIGVVAVLRRAKRHDELIRIFSKIKTDAKLLIVGDGPQKENIQNLIKELNLANRVILLGHRDDVDKILPNLDIFILPSRHEALGTSLLEAQSCGVVAIGSNVGGIPEAIDDGKSGFLFDNFDKLKEQISSLLKDDSLREQMSKNAREYIEKNFSVKQMIEKTQNLYKEIV